MKEEITNAQLFRFCAGETTVKENDRIAAWLDENPEAVSYTHLTLPTILRV